MSVICDDFVMFALETASRGRATQRALTIRLLVLFVSRPSSSFLPHSLRLLVPPPQNAIVYCFTRIAAMLTRSAATVDFPH